MSKIKYISDFAGFSITPEPVLEIRRVNGVEQSVKTTPLQIKFNNGELIVDAKDEQMLEALDSHRLYGTYFRRAEELDDKAPEEVVKEAVKKAVEPKEEIPKAEELTDTNGDGKITVDDVKNVNQAKEYLINEAGVDGRTLNSADKIKAAIADNNLEFPNLKL